MVQRSVRLSADSDRLISGQSGAPDIQMISNHYSRFFLGLITSRPDWFPVSLTFTPLSAKKRIDLRHKGSASDVVELKQEVDLFCRFQLFSPPMWTLKAPEPPVTPSGTSGRRWMDAETHTNSSSDQQHDLSCSATCSSVPALQPLHPEQRRRSCFRFFFGILVCNEPNRLAVHFSSSHKQFEPHFQESEFTQTTQKFS